MRPEGADFLELAEISPGNLTDALETIPGFVKFASILWIRALGQPTLDGIIVRRWSQQTARALRRFSTRYGFTEFLLRVDKHLSRWATRRGGYLISINEAEQIVRELDREETIASMLEPASPYRDLYCFACVTIPEQSKMIVEVVGPGFDTSDLLRGDLLPHERVELSVPLENLDPIRPAELSMKRTYLVTPNAYRKSVADRLEKIGARLKNAGFPKEVTNGPNELREDALRFLRRTGQTLLLRHAEEYDPVPRRDLLRFINGVVTILCGLERNGITLGSVTFSATITSSRRLVYWDFFPADRRKGSLLYASRPRRT